MDEVEQMVQKHFGVETAVSGSDNNMCIYVVDPGRKEDADCIQEYLSDKAQIAQKAFTVIPIKEIPRNASGKTEYHKLSENNSSTFCSKA